MGAVYRAAQLPMARPVAVKVVADQEAASALHLKRFEREARALAKLSHPNTVRLFEFGTHQGLSFLAMELLDGVDLQRRIARNGPVPCEQALRICLQVLRSLEEAHGHDLVHRDIKPANIFLCPVQGQPSFVKVLDFGIASRLNRTAAETQLTADGTVIGSVPYMSPEQTEGAKVGTATDLYAVGVVLFEMLSGTLPFRAKTLAGLYVAKATQPALRLSEVCADLDAPAALHRLVDELLVANPARRPSCARSVAERVEALLEEVAVRPRAAPGNTPHAAAGPVCAATEPLTAARGTEEYTRGPGAYDAISGEGLAHTVRSPARLGTLYGSGAILALLFAGVVAWQLRPQDPAPAPPVTPHPALDTRPSDVDRVVPPDPPPQAPQHAEPPPPQRVVPAPPEPKQAPETARAQPASASLVPAVTPAAPASPAANDLSRRYPTVAAVRAARDAGEISQQDSNALIRSLRQLRLDARTRAGNEYKAGRIGLAELKELQQKIEEAFEGPPP